ncbi:type II secretion system protein [Echinimonas agarilytica]|uniref:Type II secretion system GspH family protein n=1 Tax=Echinimonas agarilytica TaxID=1215918 RepID=A0AA41W480_9GAMM|nr:type II secretion system protein [Echinimonas agarilytica]MCM2678586.1 type II secretion system GspH family protein [Echinimonas agarilytica]
MNILNDKSSKQSGFSLIELVIVVTILGLLAVTALPRFLDVTDEAQIANIEGMAGGFATGVSLVRAQWEAEGRPKVNSKNSVVYDGIRLYLTEAQDSPIVSPGYPVGDAPSDSNSASMTSEKCIKVWNGILQNPATLTSDSSEANNNRYFVATTSADLCIFYLVQTLNRNTNGAIEDPSGSTTVGNNFVYDPANGRVSVNIN